MSRLQHPPILLHICLLLTPNDIFTSLNGLETEMISSVDFYGGREGEETHSGETVGM